MSHVVRQDIDAVNAQIVVTLTADDYGKKIKDQIKNYSKNAQIKGFRPGKAPIEVIKKMYGKSLMVDIVNNEVSKHLHQYLDNNKDTAFIGQPIFSLDQEPMDLSLEAPKDVVVRFDIGLAPQFELQGLDKNTTLDFYDVLIAEEKIDEEVAKIRKDAATFYTLERIEADSDYISLRLSFEKDGETKNNSFGILAEDLTPEAREVLNTKQVGDTFTFNLYNLEQESTDDNVKAYFLGLSKEDDASALGTDFDLTVESISNRKEAELDQAFFDKYFGEGNVSNETDMRAVVKQAIVHNLYLPNVNSLIYRNLQQVLMDKNQLELPEAFLKRWLATTNEKNTPELLDEEFPHFIKSLKWSMIRQKIAEQGQIKVTDEELREFYKSRIRQYLGGNENKELEELLANQIMEDENKYNELLEDFLTNATFSYAASQVTLVPNPIEEVEFKALIAALSAKGQDAESQEVLAEEIEEA